MRRISRWFTEDTFSAVDALVFMVCGHLVATDRIWQAFAVMVVGITISGILTVVVRRLSKAKQAQEA